MASMPVLTVSAISEDCSVLIVNENSFAPFVNLNIFNNAKSLMPNGYVSLFGSSLTNDADSVALDDCIALNDLTIVGCNCIWLDMGE